jgi:hypothetical protein
MGAKSQPMQKGRSHGGLEKGNKLRVGIDLVFALKPVL